MPCIHFQLPDGTRGIARVSGARRSKRCAYCGRPAAFLCDHPKGKRTCDRPMCGNCAHEVDTDLHQCRDHAQPGLF